MLERHGPINLTLLSPRRFNRLHAVEPDKTYEFILLARLGIFELYVGEDVGDMRLVQTSSYGRYPAMASRVGLVANHTGGAALVVTNISAHSMSL